ncbi:PIN domain-containing protein [Acetobacter estunensis]|nr:hypothetical protein [Acetobacter estunensis]
MESETDNKKSLAVLIDGDNITPRILTPLLNRVRSYGPAHLKRI